MTDADLGEITEADLLELLADEFRSGGITVDVVPADRGAPAQMLVPIHGTSHQLTINSYFLPDVQSPWALQYFVTLPYPIDDSASGDLARFVCLVNTNLPVTGFEFAEDRLGLVFRHTHAVSVHPLDPGVVAWSLSMTHAAVVNFGPLVESVAAGGDVDDAIAAAMSIVDGLLDD